MEELLTYIVKALVDNKDDVRIEKDDSNANNVTLKVYVNNADLGKVIGKNGKIANSLRAIIKGASTNSKTKYFVKIIEQ